MTYYSRKLKIPFEEVLDKITENLTQQGFGVVSSIDMQDTFRRNLGAEFRKYRILAVCHAHLACKAIALEPRAGIMVPCNVVIQEHPTGEVEVSALNPLEAMVHGQPSADLRDVAQEIGVRLRASVDFISRTLKAV